MKVLIIRTNGNVVNLKTYNLQEVGIAKALISKQIQCDILYYGGNKPNHEEYLVYKGQKIRIIWAQGFNFFNNGVFINIKKILEEYDIIQVSEYDQIFSLYLAFFSKYRKKVCLTHGPYYSDFNIKYNIKMNFIDRLWIPQKEKERIWCFAKSEYAKNFLENRGLQKIIVTGVGLDIDNLKPTYSSVENPIIQQIKIFKKNDFLLLYLGELSERRNTKFLIDLMNALCKKNKKYKLCIIGNGKPEYKQECMNLIKNNNLTENIIYFEKIEQSEVRNIYELSDLFLLPSNYEIFGMVMLEAMYYGIPVLTTDNGGSSTLIENAIDGYILPLDINEWIHIISDLDTNDNLRSFMGESARQKIITRFTWDDVVLPMIDVYQKMLK